MCCSETNQMQQLEEVIEKYKNTQGALIPVLHEAQDIFGYLPPEVMKKVSRGLEIPEAKVYGRRDLLFAVFLDPKGKISRQCLSGHRLLRQGRGGDFG